jgi:hypothetical protein
MRKWAIAALLVVAILVAAWAGFLIVVFVVVPPHSPSCNTAPGGSVLYVKIIHDETRTPVTNATVDAVPVETCNGANTTIAILTQFTGNATGVVTLDASFDTFYNITVHYGIQSYSFTADVQHSLFTCSVLSVPSGNLSITSC